VIVEPPIGGRPQVNEPIEHMAIFEFEGEPDASADPLTKALRNAADGTAAYIEARAEATSIGMTRRVLSFFSAMMILLSAASDLFLARSCSGIGPALSEIVAGAGRIRRQHIHDRQEKGPSRAVGEMPLLSEGDAAPPSEKGRAADMRALPDEELSEDEILVRRARVGVVSGP
jgi:hypothetical protein